MRGIFNGTRGLFAGFLTRDVSTSCLRQEEGEVFESFVFEPSKNLRFIGEQQFRERREVGERRYGNAGIGKY